MDKNTDLEAVKQLLNRLYIEYNVTQGESFTRLTFYKNETMMVEMLFERGVLKDWEAIIW